MAVTLTGIATARRKIPLVNKSRQAAIKAFIATMPAAARNADVRNTPARVDEAWEEMLSGYGLDPAVETAGALFKAESSDEVRIEGLRFYSVCEHHLLPFFGTASIRYTPGKHILGLSKFPALLGGFSRRLQVQERLTAQLADSLFKLLKPKNLEVILTARHLCLEMRGQKQSGELVTTAKRGKKS
jgi:GTP cyclohydrolase I